MWHVTPKLRHRYGRSPHHRSIPALLCGAIVTSPFDVKTRLQSDLFRHNHAGVGVIGNSGAVVMGAPRTIGLLYNRDGI